MDIVVSKWSLVNYFCCCCCYGCGCGNHWCSECCCCWCRWWWWWCRVLLWLRSEVHSSLVTRIWLYCATFGADSARNKLHQNIFSYFLFSHCIWVSPSFSDWLRLWLCWSAKVFLLFSLSRLFTCVTVCVCSARQLEYIQCIEIEKYPSECAAVQWWHDRTHYYYWPIESR